MFVTCTLTVLRPPHSRSAKTGILHSIIMSYSAPTLRYRCWEINAIAASHGFCIRVSRYPGNESHVAPSPISQQVASTLLLLQKRIWYFTFTVKPGHAYPRLRVVPHFSSGIVEREKRERAWKSLHTRKGDTRRGEKKIPAACSLFPRGVIFTRARVSLALLSLKKNGGLLVV